jgi:hypothetical protein
MLITVLRSKSTAGCLLLLRSAMKKGCLLIAFLLLLPQFSVFAQEIVSTKIENQTIYCLVGKYALKREGKSFVKYSKLINQERKLLVATKDKAIRAEIISRLEQFKKYNETCKSLNVDDATRATIKHEVNEINLRASFYDANYPDKIIYEKDVKEIAVNYPYSDASDFKIDSKNFAARWSGTINFAEATLKQVHVNQGWSKTKIKINGAVVFDQEVEGIFNYNFPAGISNIEVDFKNNWHTTEFYVRFLKPRKVMTLNEISKDLNLNNTTKHSYLHIGVYESKNFNGLSSIILKPTKYPVILSITSVAAIGWKINEAYKNQLAAVILSTNSTGSYIHEIPANVPVYYANLEYFGRMAPECRVQMVEGIPDHMHCTDEPKVVLNFLNKFQKFAKGKILSGYTLDYQVDTLLVPQKGLDQHGYLKLINRLNKLIESQKQYQK